MAELERCDLRRRGGTPFHGEQKNAKIPLVKEMSCVFFFENLLVRGGVLNERNELRYDDV